MKFKKIEDGVPDTNRDVLCVFEDGEMMILMYHEFIGNFIDNFYDNFYPIAWAELPEVVYE